MKKIGLIELPAIKLVDDTGKNWTALRRKEPLVSKQILIPQIQQAGFLTELINLKVGEEEIVFGEVTWRQMRLSKVLIGRVLHIEDYPDVDAWAITINYAQEREPACLLIKQLLDSGRPIVVGGSDAFSDPESYLQAGATAIVQDKSGAANKAILDYVLGLPEREPLTGVILADGRSFRRKRQLTSPEDWPVPDIETVKQTLGMEYWETSLPANQLPIGSVMTDIGCDRHCDFCETPLYKLGYKRMLPQRVIEWFASQQAAGARSIICPADQFLGRVLYKTGRDEIIAITQGAREMGLPLLWGNGLELKKATIGRGLPDSDLSPDEELIQAIWGWDGKVGCYQGYLPAERPTFGREDYAKLMPWQEHLRLVEAVVKAGVPDLTYGVIVGLPDDSHDSMLGLEEAIQSLYARVLSINPKLIFNVTPYAIRPLPGTPQAEQLRASGLLRFEDTAILGGFWTACADTLYLSYAEVSDWQIRLAAIGDNALMDWQAITGPR